MCDDPEKDRDATDAGRAHGPHRRNRVARGSVPYPSPPERKNPSENVTRAVVGRRCRTVRRWSACVCALGQLVERDRREADPDLRKRSAGSGATENGTLEVGGSGGNGRRQLAARRDGRAGTLTAVAGRSRGGRGAVERGLSVTCTYATFHPKRVGFQQVERLRRRNRGVVR